MNPRWYIIGFLACIQFRGYQAIFVFHCLSVGIRLPDIVVLGFVSSSTQAIAMPFVKRILCKFDSSHGYVAVLQTGAGLMAVGYIAMASCWSLTSAASALVIIGLGYACAFGPYYELVRRSVPFAQERAIAMSQISSDVWIVYILCVAPAMLLSGVAYGLMSVSPGTILYAQTILAVGAMAAISPLHKLHLYPSDVNQTAAMSTQNQLGPIKWIRAMIAACNSVAFNMFLPVAIELRLGDIFTTSFAMPGYMLAIGAGVMAIRRLKKTARIVIPLALIFGGVLAFGFARGPVKLLGFVLIAYSDYYATVIMGMIVGKISNNRDEMMDVVNRATAMGIVVSILCKLLLNSRCPASQVAWIVSGGLLGIACGILIFSKKSKYHLQE